MTKNTKTPHQEKTLKKNGESLSGYRKKFFVIRKKISPGLNEGKKKKPDSDTRALNRSDNGKKVLNNFRSADLRKITEALRKRGPSTLLNVSFGRSKRSLGLGRNCKILSQCPGKQAGMIDEENLPSE